ncbi:MAG: ATP-grasp domain-containing protein, partial [Thermoleophilaceae bacterium]
RGALSAARALHAAGWSVGVGSPARGGLAAASRSTERWHRVPPPELDLDKFVASVESATASAAYDLVFGSGDAELLALSCARERLSAKVPHPPHATVLRTLDKLELARAAKAVGLEGPRTVEATADELHRVEGPVMVKARLHSVPWQPGGPARIDARIAPGPDAAARRAAEIRARGGQPLLQDVVRGRLTALATVIDAGGEAHGTVQQETDVTWPPRAGVTARGRSVAVDGELLERSVALLRALEWWGLAQLQFLVPEDREPRLIDVNGRFYGSLALALSAGSNLPALWAGIATGRPLPRAEAAPGVRYQWLEGDLRRVLHDRRGSVLGEVLGCLRYAREAQHSIWSGDDLLPALGFVLDLPRRALSR